MTRRHTPFKHCPTCLRINYASTRQCNCGHEFYDLDGYKCGHPRTPENTVKVGKAGVRCKTCRRKIALKSAHKRKKERVVFDAAPFL